MRKSICNYCGSSNLIADRALGGKLICRDCSRPLSSTKNYKFPIKKNNHLSLITIFFLSIIVVVILSK